MDALTTLTRLGGGKFLDALADHIRLVSQEVVRTGKKGGVSATITIEQFEDEPEVIVTATVQPKPPSEKPTAALFFALDGELSMSDSRKPELPLFRTVDQDTGEIRTLPDEEPVVKEVAE